MKLSSLQKLLTKSRCLLVILIGITLSVQATEYIPLESTWKYKDDGSNQGTAWRASGFNDASWSSGAAQLGFGDSDEATVINDVNQYSNYFRKQFTVADASIYGTLDLEMVRDDGAVVYLNGVEIWRDNMPSGTINYNTLASGNASPENGVYTTTVSSANLVTGINTIAVEVHQSSPTSSDVSFDFSLTAVLATEGIVMASSWKYLDNGSNQGTAWRAGGFNDASWSSGAAQLGFGDGDESTVINDVNQFSTYFRKQFSIVDASTYVSIDLEMIRDDGAVVYLNGSEVWRSNMPSGTINYNTLAASNVSGGAEDVINTISIPTTNLVSGTNTIAVEIHQDNQFSSDVSFDFALIPQTTVPYLNFGATWKYKDDGSNQGTAWRATGFNDASWSAGSAQLGYGDGDETTTVSYGGNASDKYETTYFRTSFSASGFSPSDYFELSMIRDDGAIVYLNGTEIWRNNMGSGSVTYTTLASANVSGSSESTPITLLLPSTSFVDGTNVLAVEIHQDNVSSSDISFDFKVENVGTPELTLDRGPYLQTLTKSSVIVKWRTNLPTNSFVAYGTSVGSLNDTIYNATNVSDHELTVSGLTTANKYYYSIGNTDTTFVGNDTDHFFVTAPADSYTGITRAWVLGDAGTANNNQRAVRDAYYDYVDSAGATDMILMLGDNAYNDGTDEQYQDAMFEDMYEDIIRQTVTWSCPGNHDIYSANSSTQTGPYYDIFTFPKAAEAGGLASGTEAYYSWDYGQIHFVSLDSDDTDRSPGGSMLTWLTNDLAATTKKWIVVIFHHPPYTKGSHDSDNAGDSGGRMRDMREDVLPIIENYGVDLVLSGHSHSYERSYFLNGHYDVSGTLTAGMKVDDGSGKLDVDCSYKKTTSGVDAGKGAVYITAGSSGKITGTLTAHPAMYAYLYQMGSVIVEIEEDRMDVKFLNNSGSTTDYFTIDKDITNASIDTTVNSGNSITLTASWGDDFVWSPGGATTQSIVVSPLDTTQYIVKNASGCLADTFNVAVVTVNTAPTAVNDAVGSINDTIEIDVLDNDSDAELQPITIASIVSVPNNGGNASINNNGTPANPADDFIDYNPSGVYFGLEIFQYSICDNGSPALCDTALVSVAVTVNVAPVANDDNESVTYNSSTTVDVLDNDSDANGQDLAITSISSIPDHGGIATINNNLTPGDVTDDFIDFTPSGVYIGDESFDYIICDNGTPNYCDTASVTVTITSCPDGSTVLDSASWDYGAEWKYNDSGANLGTTWRNAGYIDDCWSYGNSKLGFGDAAPPGTLLTNHGGATYYFRKHFTISDVSAIQELDIDMIRDDGAVIYVNGSEVYRSNMPTGTITYDVTASLNVSGPAETTEHSFLIPASYLVNGNNVIAVEVHQDNVGSSDIGFDFKSTVVESDASTWFYEEISGNVFLDTDFSRTYNGGDYGSGALVIEAYQDRNSNSTLDYGDALVASGISNIDGAYELEVYPPKVPAISVSPSNSSEDAIEDASTGAMTLSSTQMKSADATGPSTLLFDSTATWKYYDSGFPASDWYEIGFDDSGWASGGGDFGFGDGYANTTLTLGEPAFYFRKEFTISAPNGPNYGLALGSAKVDDGIVVYINGVEVIRRNMPDGKIVHSTYAAVNVNYINERSIVDIHIPNPGFVSGINTIAVEIHQQSPGSSDMHFNFGLSVYDIDVDELGVRFNNVQVPKDAEIVDAWLIMKSAEAAVSISTVNVVGEAIDNSPAFSTTANDISSRSRTSSTRRQSSLFPILENEDFKVSSLGPIISEITNRPGWSSGNAISLFLNGFTNEFYSYDGDNPVLLVVSYIDTSNSSVEYLMNIKQASLPEEVVYMTDKNPVVTLSEGARVSGVNIGYLGTTSMCVASADDSYDQLHIINRFNGANTIVGSFVGSRQIEAIALSRNADSLFAVDGDSLGLVDFTTGVFSSYGTRIGSGNGSAGSFTFSDIDGLAFDLDRGVLWATQRRLGAADLLLVIDHTTGLLVSDFFGPGIDYLVTSGAGLLDDLDDIAVNPNTGNLFAMNNDGGTITNLIEIDASTGSATIINSTGINDMEGQGFHNDGKFYSTSGRIGTPSNVFFEVDTLNASLTPIGYFASAGDYEGCDCKSGPYISFLEGLVFSDENENAIYDAGDILDEDVTVYLYEDLDNDSVITVADLLIDSVETDSTGSYFFGVNRKGVFLINFDGSDLPEGSALTTSDIQEARFTSNGNFDSNNDFGYRNGAALPVELASFYGKHEEGVHYLYWITSTEINNSHFNVFRSSDGIFFEGIGKVEGAGNSNAMQSYHLNDYLPLPGQNYYRLQQVDFDGASEYSKIINLFNGGNAQEQTINIWPNPVENTINMDGLQQFSGQEVLINIVDLYGNIRMQNEVVIQHNSISLDINDLNKGYYLLEISTLQSKQSISFVKN